MGRLIQFEMSAVNLALSLRDLIRHNRICINEEFPTPAGTALVSSLQWPLGWARQTEPRQKSVYFREDFGSEPISGYIAAKSVQLVQPVEVSISTLAQLTTAGVNPPPASLVLKLQLVFGLQVYAIENDVILHIGFNAIEGLPSGLAALDSLKQRIQALFPGSSMPLDIGKLSGLGGKPRVANADIAAVIVEAPPGAAVPFLAEESFLAIRVEIGNYPTSIAGWQSFFAASPEILFGRTGRGGFAFAARSWAVFIDSMFVEDGVRNRVEHGEDGTGGLAGSSQFRLQGGISSSWSAVDGGATVDIHFYGDALGACDLGILGSTNIGLEVQTPVEFSVVPPPQPFVFDPGAIQQRIKLNFWKNDWDTAVCVLGVAALWPYIGPKLMDEHKIKWYEMLVAGAIPVLIAYAGLKEGLKVPSSFPPPSANCVRQGDSVFVCTEPFELGGIPLGGAPRVQDYFGRPDGLIVLGDMFWTQRVARAFGIASITIQDFKLTVPHLSCGQVGPLGFAWLLANPTWFSTYRAVVSLYFEGEPLPSDNAATAVSINPNDNLAPYCCWARVRPQDDPLGVFAPHVAVNDSTDVVTVTLNIPLTAVHPTYFRPGQSYPCRLLVQTSGGARMITLPAIKQASEAEIDRATKAGWAAGVSDCYAKSNRWDFRWRIDPQERYRERHFWDVTIGRLQAGERVSLLDRQGKTLAATQANERGEAWMKAVLTPEAYQGEATLYRSSARQPLAQSGAKQPRPRPDAAIPAEYLSIDIKQTQLLELAQFDLGGPLQNIAPFMAGSSVMVAMAIRDGVLCGDFSYATRPRIVWRSPLAGTAGVISFASSLFAWGEQGLFEIDPETGRSTRLLRFAVEAMAVAGSVALVLRAGRLEVWDRHRQRRAAHEVPHGRHLAVAGKRVLVGSRENVTVFHQAEDGTLHCPTEHPVAGLARIATRTFASEGNDFVLACKAGGARFVSSDHQLLQTGEIQSSAGDLLNFSRYRDLAFEVVPGASALHVLRAGLSVRV